MASPWKFLARLTSRRRERNEPKGGIPADTKLEEVTNPRSDERATDNSSARLVAWAPQNADQADAALTVREHFAEAGGGAKGTIDLDSVKLVDASDPALSDDRDFTTTPTQDKMTVSSSKKGPSARQKRRQKARVIKPISVFPLVPANAPSFFDEVQSLDEEIRLLRDRLVHRLQMQNAQLRMMLERFER
jgi:hypothetical protein